MTPVTYLFYLVVIYAQAGVFSVPGNGTTIEQPDIVVKGFGPYNFDLCKQMEREPQKWLPANAINVQVSCETIPYLGGAR